MKNKLFCGLCVLFLLFLSGCKQNRQVMRLQKLEEGVSSPTTIEELQGLRASMSEDEYVDYISKILGF